MLFVLPTRSSRRTELERRVAARTSTQPDAYRAEIILRVAGGQTDAAIAHDMGLAERTIFLCGIVSPSTAWMGSKTIQSVHHPANTTPTSRLDSWYWPASEVDPRRAGQTHWSIKDLIDHDTRMRFAGILGRR